MAGVEEFLQPDGVTVIEWAERLSRVEGRGSSAGENWLRVNMEIVGETERKITYDDFGT
jgi:tRNA A37 threonylcarbamoyladenosine biosynthesis protein TsaE